VIGWAVVIGRADEVYQGAERLTAVAWARGNGSGSHFGMRRHEALVDD